MVPERGLRIAMLTTIVPAKEPIDVVERSLLAMQKVRYAGHVDIWILDEGDDPRVKAMAKRLGVHHFSRKGRPQFNQEHGPFRAKTKAGNHNAWRATHEHVYDVVAQMDPDHVPSPDFLERSLGYFMDPDVGFVVAPQVYGNIRENWIARASAFQAYVFHGVIQRGGNGMRAPLLIGTNHLYRVTAFSDIGGYQDSIIEDHLTSMAMFAKRNARGNYWKGVYTPDILAIGEGPTSFTDYFNQQKRWAYGIWEIAGKHSPKLFGGMRPAQRLTFSMLQFFYPSVAVSWVLSNLLSVLYLTGHVQGKPIWQWAIAWGLSVTTSLSFFFWLRRFNLVEHERKDWGLGGMSLLVICIPVYVSAGVQALRGKALSYAVTAKGNLTSPDTTRTFASHMTWMTVNLSMLVVSICGVGSAFIGTRLWLLAPLAACLSPLVIHLSNRRRGIAIENPESTLETEPLPSQLVLEHETT
jgi:cellulose synthase/poly-beta-1,6-N-acetylglucosamine synthase-like glycosyltransferase